MNKTVIYSNESIELFIDSDKKILYIDVLNEKYDKDNFLQAIEYYKNFWVLVSNSDDKYYQIFILNNTTFYPFEIYDLVFKTLQSLEDIFKKNLYSSCVVNDSNAMDIFRPLLNMYKAVRPFKFVKTLEDSYTFLYNNNEITT